MPNSLFYAFFQNTAGQGVTGLTGTVDIYKVSKTSPFTSTLFVGTGTVTAIGSGLYYIGVTGTDQKNFDYPAVFKTTGSVSSMWLPSIRWDSAESWTTEYGYLDATITSRMATGTAVTLTSTERTMLITGTSHQTWDEILTPQTHNIANSSGKRLRQVASPIVDDGTLQAGGNGYNTVQLAVTAPSTSIDPSLILFSRNTDKQIGRVIQYDTTTKIATLRRNLKTQVDNTWDYQVMVSEGGLALNDGLCQGGTTTSAYLNSFANQKTNAYKNQLFVVSANGDAEDEVRVITTSYLDGGMVKIEWDTDKPLDAAPTTSTSYEILPLYTNLPSENAASIWTYASRSLTTFGTLVSDIWTYVTRTLTSGGGGGGATAQEVWEYATRTLTQTAHQIIHSLTDNTQINVYKSTTFNVLLQNLPDFTGWQKMWFTVKEDSAYEIPDTESIIQIQLTAPTGTVTDGLLYVNKNPATLTDGYLSVISGTELRVKVGASVTGDLPPKKLYYGIKYINADGDTVALTEGGEFVIHHSTSKKVS